MCRTCATNSDENTPYVAAFPTVLISAEDATVKKIRKLLHDAQCVLPRKEGYSIVALDVSTKYGCGFITEAWTDEKLQERLSRWGDIKLYGCYRVKKD